MEEGEERLLRIPCELGYGRRDEGRMQWFLRTMVPNGYEVHTGNVLRWENPANMSRVPVWVVDETEDALLIDFNHPFAGKTLEYRVKLESLE